MRTHHARITHTTCVYIIKTVIANKIYENNQKKVFVI